MATPLLRTKLYVPSVRPGLNRRLTLISAPAGFGKTTLLSEWISHFGQGSSDSGSVATSEHTVRCQRSEIRNRVSWLSLDKGDNDPTRFWSYFIAALQTADPDVGGAALAMLEASQTQSLATMTAPVSAVERIEAIVASLINEIVAFPKGRIVLVLDDYHLIEAQPIHDALAFLLDHLPPQMHLVIASRADPPLPLSRLRGRGQLSELRTADLRFTPGEAASLLRSTAGLYLSVEELAALGARTEGWVAGLQMAAIALQGVLSTEGSQLMGRDEARSATDFVAAFAGSNRYVLDYLADEVLLQQPEDVQSFLLRTAILDRLTGPLCDVVLDDGLRNTDGALSPTVRRPASSGRQILEYLERANLFLVPLDHEGEWYRYHQLFADLLRKRLGRTYPDLVPALHLRASVWYEREGHVAEAVSHALAAPDYERAAGIIEPHVLQLIHRGDAVLARGWLEALPESVVRARPRFCVTLAWAAVVVPPVSLELAERWMQEAETALVKRHRLGINPASLIGSSTTLSRETWLPFGSSLPARTAKRLGRRWVLLCRPWISSLRTT